MARMNSESVVATLQEVIPILSASGISYWLGRGILRNYILSGEIGELQSDVDFHIWQKDSSRMKEYLNPRLTELGYILAEKKPYKFNFKNAKKNRCLEFMFLEKDESGNVFHARIDGRKGPHPIECFNEHDTLIINGVEIPIPKGPERYLESTYPNWRSNDPDLK